MKIKVGDLTGRQLIDICIQYKRCKGCPLKNVGSSSTYSCLIPYKEQFDNYEVDIPDNLSEGKEDDSNDIR